jgi:hypothetical protein
LKHSYLKTFNIYVPFFEKISVVSAFILKLKVTTKCEYLYTATFNQNTQVHFSQYTCFSTPFTSKYQNVQRDAVTVLS